MIFSNAAKESEWAMLRERLVGLGVPIIDYTSFLNQFVRGRRELIEYRLRVIEAHGYDPDCSHGAGTNGCVKIVIDDSAVSGYPAITLQDAERMVGRRGVVWQALGRYTQVYFGSMFGSDPPAAEIGEFEPHDW